MTVLLINENIRFYTVLCAVHERTFSPQAHWHERSYRFQPTEQPINSDNYSTTTTSSINSRRACRLSYKVCWMHAECTPNSSWSHALSDRSINRTANQIGRTDWASIDTLAAASSRRSAGTLKTFHRRRRTDKWNTLVANTAVVSSLFNRRAKCTALRYKVASEYNSIIL